MIPLSELDVSQQLLDKIQQELNLGNRVFEINLNGVVKYFSTKIKENCLGLRFKLYCLETGLPYIISLEDGKEIISEYNGCQGKWQLCSPTKKCCEGLTCKANQCQPSPPAPSPGPPAPSPGPPAPSPGPPAPSPYCPPDASNNCHTPAPSPAPGPAPGPPAPPSSLGFLIGGWAESINNSVGKTNVQSIINGGGNMVAIQGGNQWQMPKGESYPIKIDLSNILKISIPDNLKLYAAPGGTDGAQTSFNYPDEYEGVVFDVEAQSSGDFKRGDTVIKHMQNAHSQGKKVIYCPAGLPWNPSDSKNKPIQDSKYWNVDWCDAVAPMFYWAGHAYEPKDAAENCDATLTAMKSAIKDITPHKPMILTYESVQITENDPACLSKILELAKTNKNIIGIMGWLSRQTSDEAIDTSNIKTTVEFFNK